ncbi:unnamed protein product [Ectocarpus sp. CCAP 1310/34]|nr:unnamed protein product [Ectocarpus sp. CCAP 1310/34]
MAEQDLASLLAPLPPSPIEGNADVDARACTEGEDNQYKEEVSATQANRLWDFRGHGGFKRDSRGVHRRDWIMSEEDLKDELIKWMRTQKRLTVKDVQNYINQWLFASEIGDLSTLLSYQVNLPVSMSTTHSWMIALGCKYEQATKSFYTDGHEEKVVVVYRGKYIDVKRKLALRQPLWVRVQRDTLTPEELQRLDGIKGPAEDFCAEDESVYKVYAREGKEWVLQGVRGIRKRNEGPGEMVSAFQDERHGFGLPLTDDVLQAVNARRKEKGKEDLTRSPDLRFLQHGKNKDGYWGYDEFKEQIEDVLDVLDVFSVMRDLMP